jgi:hypothetical protein
LRDAPGRNLWYTYPAIWGEGAFMMFAVMHILVLLIVAWFVLFAASKAEGLVRVLGNLLAAILLLIAIAGAVCAGAHMMGYKIPGMGIMHEHRDHGEQPPAAPDNP